VSPAVAAPAIPDITSCLETRRRRVAEAWNLSDDIVLFGAGELISVPGGADQVYPFIAHAEFFWLTDHETPGGVLAFDPKDGWVEFVPDVTEAERVWEGKQDTPGRPLSDFPGWLATRRGRRIALLGVPIPGLKYDAARSEELRVVLLHARRPKDAVEMERIRAAAAASAAGYAVAAERIKPGMTERQIQILMEAEFFKHGGDRTGYGTIVAAGAHSAVLHFTPGERVIREGDVVLIDAGAEVRRYVIDITRTYRAAGGDDGFYRELYTVVKGVTERTNQRCVVGAEWRELHVKAATEIADGLRSIGLLRGDPATLVERDTVALFFPHGIGHMVGLGVRDASGYLPGRVRSTKPGMVMLRTDLPLEREYVMTVEPGVYFIPTLLRNPENRSRHADAVNWSRVDALLEFGGIRIEDNVRVTDGAPENLTAAVPK